MWQTLNFFIISNLLALKQVLWRTKNFFQNLEYVFLVINTTVESAKFPHKFDLSKANVKANRMGCTKWTYHNKGSLVTNYNFCSGASKSWFNVPISQVLIFIIFVRVWVLFEGMFSLWVSLTWFFIKVL